MFLTNYFSVNTFAQSPAPDIKTNNSDTPVAIEEGGDVNISVSLGPGSSAGQQADFWVWADSPFGTYWYTLNSAWVPSDSPIRVYGGALFNLSPYNVLDMSLPNGAYTFNFSVDGNMDEVKNDTFMDSVSVTVGPGGSGSPGTYSLPDTGQTGSYTETFGEDSDYTINPPSFTDNVDGTVTDNNTGLMWQQEDDNTRHTWYEASGTADALYNEGAAINVCGSLTLAGHSDWRLPNIKELSSIVDINALVPAIDVRYFPNTNSYEYWSSTSRITSPEIAREVAFGFGSVDNQLKSDQRPYVRCVRGGQ